MSSPKVCNTIFSLVIFKGSDGKNVVLPSLFVQLLPTLLLNRLKNEGVNSITKDTCWLQTG